MTVTRKTARFIPLLFAMAGLVALLAVPTRAAAPAAKTAVVVHGLTYSMFFPDDICGPRAGTTTFTIRTQVLRATEDPEGTFNVTFVDTGTYHVDFVEPAIADQGSQFTHTAHHAFTPGEVEIFNLTFHDFPTGIKIWERVHATFVNEQGELNHLGGVRLPKGMIRFVRATGNELVREIDYLQGFLCQTSGHVSATQ